MLTEEIKAGNTKRYCHDKGVKEIWGLFFIAAGETSLGWGKSSNK
jgi:hypothetical protein